MWMTLDAQRTFSRKLFAQQRFNVGIRQFALRLNDAPLFQHTRQPAQPGDHATQTRTRRCSTPSTERFPSQAELRMNDASAVFTPKRRWEVFDQHEDQVTTIVIAGGDTPARSRQMMVHDCGRRVKTTPAG